MSGELQVEGGPTGLNVLGTTGTVKVSTGDIAGLAANAAQNAAAVGAVGLELAELAVSAALAEAGSFDPLGAAEVAAAMTAAGVGPHGVAAALARLTVHAEHLTRAAVEYELAEIKVAGLVSTGDSIMLGAGLGGFLTTTARNVASEAADVFKDWAAGKPVNESLKKNGLDLLREEAEPILTQLGLRVGLLAQAGGLVALGARKLGLPTGGYPLETLQGGTQGSGALLAWALGATSLGTTGMRLQVTPRSSVTRKAKGGVNGIAANGLDTVVKHDSVAVTAVHNPGQPTRYILAVPGTTSWTDNRHPLDSNSNFQEEAGISSDARRLALAAARAKIPAGSEVMIVGYSQGGIVAANLAADPEINRQYRVGGLMTMASPTARILPRVPAQVQSLAVEHPDDLVPYTDGARAVPTDHQWVVRADTPSGSGFHDYEGYRQNLDRFATSTDPRAVAYRRAVDRFTAKQGATVTVTQFDGRRVRK